MRKNSMMNGSLFQIRLAALSILCLVCLKLNIQGQKFYVTKSEYSFWGRTTEIKEEIVFLNLFDYDILDTQCYFILKERRKFSQYNEVVYPGIGVVFNVSYKHLKKKSKYRPFSQTTFYFRKEALQNSHPVNRKNEGKTSFNVFFKDTLEIYGTNIYQGIHYDEIFNDKEELRNYMDHKYRVKDSCQAYVSLTLNNFYVSLSFGNDCRINTLSITPIQAYTKPPPWVKYRKNPGRSKICE